MSSFGGDALNSGGGEDPQKPKKSRLQRLIEWTKKKRKRKSVNTVRSKAAALKNFCQFLKKIMVIDPFPRIAVGLLC